MKLHTLLMVWGIMLALAMPATSVAAPPDFTELVKENSASVVNISTRRDLKEQDHPVMPEIPFQEGSPLYEFWKKFFEENQKTPSDRMPTSLGSGFIISSDGYIVTNYHVIKDAGKIIVRFNDRRELTATLVGHDELTDLALLKVKARNLKAIKLGSSRDLLPGQWVVAIGAPFGFEYSVTAGVISGTNRTLPWDSHVPFIQTDVATNPGNSGGPLLNLDGEVVGINSQIYSRTGSFAGLAFVIPIEFAMNTIEQIKEKGHVSHGWLGVYVQEVTYELARSFGMERPTGALVANVVDDSPADKAGIKTGDIILKFDDKVVRSSKTLPHMVGMVIAGKEKEVELLRNNKRETVEVTLGELSSQFLRTGKQPPREDDTILGMRVRKTSMAETEDMKLAEPALLVTDVMGDSVAQRGGVRKGDAILMISGERVTTIKELKEIVDSLPRGQFVALLVHRSGQQQFLTLRIPDNDTE